MYFQLCHIYHSSNCVKLLNVGFCKMITKHVSQTKAPLPRLCLHGYQGKLQLNKTTLMQYCSIATHWDISNMALDKRYNVLDTSCVLLCTGIKHGVPFHGTSLKHCYYTAIRYFIDIASLKSVLFRVYKQMNEFTKSTLFYPVKLTDMTSLLFTNG